MSKRWFVLLVILFVGVACNLPGGGAAVPQEGMQTAAAMTVQAALAQTTGTQGGEATAPAGGEQASPTPAPAVTVLPTAAATSTPVPTATPRPTATPKPCNLATFIKDVTVPDGTEFQPGHHFTKTWRLKNVGTCTWHNYALVFDSGEQMGAPASVALPGTVAPGQEVDVSVDMVAPGTSGTYRGNWRLRDDKGVIFGLTNGNPFWVEIKVVSPTLMPIPTLPPMTIIPLPTATPTPSTITVTLHLLLNESGHVDEGGGVGIKPWAGSYHDRRMDGFLSFDISSIPASAHIQSVTLDISDASLEGDVFGILGWMRIYHAEYGTLDAGDFVPGFPVGAIYTCSSPPAGPFSSNGLTNALISRLGHNRIQFRYQFRYTNGTHRYMLHDAILRVTYLP